MKKANKVSISAANLIELKKLAKNFTSKTIALKRRPGMGGLNAIIPVIIQDPGNPDQVKICWQFIVKNSDGTFTVLCICDGGVSNGFCGGGSPA